MLRQRKIQHLLFAALLRSNLRSSIWYTLLFNRVWLVICTKLAFQADSMRTTSPNDSGATCTLIKRRGNSTRSHLRRRRSDPLSNLFWNPYTKYSLRFVFNSSIAWLNSLCTILVTHLLLVLDSWQCWWYNRSGMRWVGNSTDKGWAKDEHTSIARSHLQTFLWRF